MLLTKSATKALAVKVNVSRKIDADTLVETTLKEFSKIDILINAAGIVRYTRLVNLEERKKNGTKFLILMLKEHISLQEPLCLT